jgi:hypothetical protein
MSDHKYKQKGKTTIWTDFVLMNLFYQSNSFNDICNVIYVVFLNLCFQKPRRRLH